MDFYPIAQSAFEGLAAVGVGAALALARAALKQAQAKWHFVVSQTMQDNITADITAAVDTGIGWGRAKLASGQMALEHVSTGNPIIDQMAQAGMNMLSDQAKTSGITTDDIARRIVAGIGHALGNDPGVPSVAVPSSLAEVHTATVRALLGGENVKTSPIDPGAAPNATGTSATSAAMTAVGTATAGATT